MLGLPCFALPLLVFCGRCCRRWLTDIPVRKWVLQFTRGCTFEEIIERCVAVVELYLVSKGLPYELDGYYPGSFAIKGRFILYVLISIARSRG